jgi:hypothetical protein
MRSLAHTALISDDWRLDFKWVRPSVVDHSSHVDAGPGASNQRCLLGVESLRIFETARENHAKDGAGNVSGVSHSARLDRRYRPDVE